MRERSRVGETVKLGYVDQDRSLDPTKSVYDIISEGHETLCSARPKSTPGPIVPGSTLRASISRRK